MSKHRNKHYKRITVCRDCNGNGFVLVDADTHSMDYQKRICTTCMGSGMVNVEIELKYTPFLKGVNDVVKHDIN